MSDTAWAILEIVAGLLLLVGGGELLVRGASRLAAWLSISPLLIGLTVVAFGTSAPELAVSLKSAFSGNPDVAIGNVIGSNIFNILFILGLSASILPLFVSSQLIRRDVPIMIAASLMLYFFSWNGNIGRVDGAILFACLLVYLTWCIWQSRREGQEVIEEFARELPKEKSDGRRLAGYILLILIGLALLVFGSNSLVKGSVTIAQMLGVSELVIGLTVVAVGTSLPEVATSVLAAVRGEREIAVGNVVGSNLFNIFCVIGLSGIVSPQGVDVSLDAMEFDIPVMIAVAIACLPIFLSGHVIARWEGAVFLFYYFAYMAYLVLDATGSGHSRTLFGIMGFFVVPLTVVTLIISVLRSLNESRQTRLAKTDSGAKE